MQDLCSAPAGFTFCCPRCHSPLESTSAEALRCPVDELTFSQINGVWRFILPERALHFEQFMHEYETVRRGEGRGSAEPDYYRALPFRDLTRRFTADWRIRAASYQTFLRSVVLPRERQTTRPLRILDLGAGNGWLSARLAARGHHLAAVDLQTNRFDGLGAQVNYAVRFLALQAEFDRLPFGAGQADVLVYNASFHYAENYRPTLCEALRVLDVTGKIVVIDPPLYHDGYSGKQMVHERETHFRRQFGLASNALASENYLTDSRLNELAVSLGLRWQRIQPFYGLRWMLRPLVARLRRRREPARFAVLVAERI